MGLRIGNTGLLVLQRSLLGVDADLQRSLLQLATGLRINSAADGPAALAISEQLRAGIASQGALIRNTERALNLVQTAEGALTEVSAQLNSLRGLVIEAANTGVNGESALAAIQSEIDNTVGAITRIAENTRFVTQNLLNGDLNDTQFQVTGGDPVTLTVPSLAAEDLGTGVVNDSAFANLAEIDVTTAQGAADALAIIDAAQAEVTQVRADLGAFQQNVLESNVNSLRVARENLLTSESTIRDAIFSEVTARTSLLNALLQSGVALQSRVLQQQSGLFLNLLA